MGWLVQRRAQPPAPVAALGRWDPRSGKQGWAPADPQHSSELPQHQRGGAMGACSRCYLCQGQTQLHLSPGCTLLCPQLPPSVHGPQALRPPAPWGVKLGAASPLSSPRRRASSFPALPAQRDLCGTVSPPPVPARRAEVGTEERTIDKCKYSREAPGQSCEGHRNVCQQISNPPSHWHLTKCHCE